MGNLGWTYQNELKATRDAQIKPRAVTRLIYECECMVNNEEWASHVQLCSTHRALYAAKSFSWLVTQLSSGMWPPQLKSDDVGKVEEGA